MAKEKSSHSSSSQTPQEAAAVSISKSSNDSKQKKNNKKQVDANWKTLLATGKVKRKTNNAASKRRNTAAEQEKKTEKVQVNIDWTRRKASKHLFNTGRLVALDCEMVGVGTNGRTSHLARVCVLNEEGHILLDTFVKPREKVTDYRTKWSGVRAKDLQNAPSFWFVQQQVADLIRGKVLVGHALKHDMEVLELKHPPTKTRDTALYKPLQKLNVVGKLRAASLKVLTEIELNKRIQEGEHDPYIDARAALELYKKHAQEWEENYRKNRALRKREREKRGPNQKRAREESTNPPQTGSAQQVDDIFKSKRPKKE